MYKDPHHLPDFIQKISAGPPEIISANGFSYYLLFKGMRVKYIYVYSLLILRKQNISMFIVINLLSRITQSVEIIIR